MGGYLTVAAVPGDRYARSVTTTAAATGTDSARVDTLVDRLLADHEPADESRVLGFPGEPRTDKDLPWTEVPRS
jgi:hypothetical protein